MSIIAYKNARLLCPAQNIDMTGHMLVEGGTIKALGEIDISNAKHVVDCSGKALIPGLIDMQVFTGEPGQEHRETLATASHAAAAGGVTSMVVMPNTDPAIDDAALVDFIMRRARDTAIIRILPMAAITKSCAGAVLTEFGLLKEAGAIAFSDADQAVMNALTMRRALTYAANFEALIMQHAMDRDLASAGVMHEGELSTRMGLTGIPAAAETSIIERDIRLAELCDARYHIAQISSAQSLAPIKAAKARGVKISCSVSINHLSLNENDVTNYRSFAKLNPPLRSEADRQALVQALADGVIDAVVSAHNPQDAEAKRQPFAQAAYGAVGLELLLPGLISLAYAHDIPVLTMLKTVTSNPARILDLPSGTLEAGAAADFCLLDLETPWTVDADTLRSKSQNAAMEGRNLQGRVQTTYIDGKPVFKAN